MTDAATIAGKQAQLERAWRDNIVHSLRCRGWSRIDAENEADDRIEKRRAILAQETDR